MESTQQQKDGTTDTTAMIDSKTLLLFWKKEAIHKRIHSVWPLLHEVQEQAN